MTSERWECRLHGLQIAIWELVNVWQTHWTYKNPLEWDGATDSIRDVVPLGPEIGLVRSIEDCMLETYQSMLDCGPLCEFGRSWLRASNDRAQKHNFSSMPFPNHTRICHYFTPSLHTAWLVFRPLSNEPVACNARESAWIWYQQPTFRCSIWDQVTWGRQAQHSLHTWDECRNRNFRLWTVFFLLWKSPRSLWVFSIHVASPTRHLNKQYPHNSRLV
jgi:hypothetical protein